MRLYMKFREKNSAVVAAAKAAFSPATAYRLRQDGRLPSQKKTPRGRRRPDPLGDLFDTEIVPLLEAAPGLRAVAIFDAVLRRRFTPDPKRLPQVTVRLGSLSAYEALLQAPRHGQSA
jgi:hypothetical protein